MLRTIAMVIAVHVLLVGVPVDVPAGQDPVSAIVAVFANVAAIRQPA